MLGCLYMRLFMETLCDDIFVVYIVECYVRISILYVLDTAMCLTWAYSFFVLKFLMYLEGFWRVISLYSCLDMCQTRVSNIGI